MPAQNKSQTRSFLPKNKTKQVSVQLPF